MCAGGSKCYCGCGIIQLAPPDWWYQSGANLQAFCLGVANITKRQHVSNILYTLATIVLSAFYYVFPYIIPFCILLCVPVSSFHGYIVPVYRNYDVKSNGPIEKQVTNEYCFVFTSLIQVQDVLPRWTYCQEIQVGAKGMHTCANTLLPHRFRTIWVNFTAAVSQLVRGIFVQWWMSC